MKNTILIADDEKISLHIIEKYLLIEEKDYRIIKALDGKQALDMCKKFLPDIVILDYNMPILNADEIIKELKKDSLTKNIPIIALSSNFSDKDINQLLKEGAFDFLTKPIKKTELKARIHAALNYSDALKEIQLQRERIDSHIDELNKLSTIIKQTDNSVIIFSPEGEIEWANEGFKYMYGISLEDFINRYGNNLFEVSFNKEAVLKKIEEIKELKKSVFYTSLIKNFNNIKEKWVQTTLTPIFDDLGEIERIVAIETDITKIKKYEQELKGKNNEMKILTEKLTKTNEELLRQKNLIQDERKKTDKLLENIIPHHVASQLKSIGYARPRKYRMATIMFTDFKGFTKSCEHLNTDQIVKYLNAYFSYLDDIVVNHYIEKIKTIGDAYMCVGGIPLRNRSNPFDVLLVALEIQNMMNNLDEFDPKGELPRWQIRLGIHTGPLIAGVVGKIKFAYDVWGDSVNIASRMESAGEPGRINISQATFNHIKDYFECEYRGEIPMKNRGKMGMYFVNRLKPEYSEDVKGVFPNETFSKILDTL